MSERRRRDEGAHRLVHAFTRRAGARARGCGPSDWAFRGGGGLIKYTGDDAWSACHWGIFLPLALCADMFDSIEEEVEADNDNDNDNERFLAIHPLS